jgi:hypothetical protein
MLAIATTLVLAFVGGRPSIDMHSSTAGKLDASATSGPGTARPAGVGETTNDCNQEKKAC